MAHNYKLPCQIKEYTTRRNRCAHLVQELSGMHFETVKVCNICGSDSISIISATDRYGLPIRSGMCQRCGLVFLMDRFTEEGYSRFYQDYYRPLGSAYLGREINAQSMQGEQRRYGQTLVKTFRHLLDLNENHSLIDIGGSTGLVASEFVKEFGLSATILDPSPDEIEIAKKEGFKTICDLYEKWDWDGEEYDLVLCCRTIDHFFDLRKSLLKLRKLCKTTGYLLIDIIDVEAIRKVKGLIEGAIKIDHPYYLCSEITPVILLSIGFEVVYSEIVTQHERVTYICRPIEDSSTDVRSDREWIAGRIRNLQDNRFAVANTKGSTCDWKEATHKWLYRRKQALRKVLKV